MELTTFSDAQRDALLDLAVLAVYADAHLAAAELERVERLLTAMGITSEYERTTRYDASVARVSRHTGSLDKVRAQARTLAQTFADAEQRKIVHELLRDIVGSDSRVSPQESTFLATVRETLEL